MVAVPYCLVFIRVCFVSIRGIRGGAFFFRDIVLQMNKLKFWLILGLITSCGAAPLFSFQMNRQAKVRAPELTGGRGWLNTDKPLSIAGLKGKMVLLDFWTYGCINCIHIIPDLKRLEAKYPDNLVVIGVHSAKFENEKDTDNIRNIILRYGLEHPVVNDADFKIWDAYAIRAWPGRVLIDPAGYIIGTWFGEGRYDEIDSLISGTITDFRKKGGLNEEPLRFALERAKVDVGTTPSVKRLARTFDRKISPREVLSNVIRIARTWVLSMPVKSSSGMRTVCSRFW